MTGAIAPHYHPDGCVVCASASTIDNLASIFCAKIIEARSQTCELLGVSCLIAIEDIGSHGLTHAFDECCSFRQAKSTRVAVKLHELGVNLRPVLCHADRVTDLLGSRLAGLRTLIQHAESSFRQTGSHRGQMGGSVIAFECDGVVQDGINLIHHFDDISDVPVRV